MTNLISIDLIRFFAAFSVFWYHQKIGLLLSKYSGFEFLRATDYVGAFYAVPLFFLISGFCIHLSNLRTILRREPLNLNKYLSKRFWRIYPPYVVALLLSMAVTTMTDYKPEINTTDFLTHIFNLQGFSEKYFNTINLVFWTITVEMAFYAVYPIYYFVTIKYSANHALLLSFIVSLISNIIFTFNSAELTLPGIFFFTNLWFGWCFGAWICHHWYTKKHFFVSNYWVIITLIIGVFFASSIYFDYNNSILLRNIANILIWAPILILLIKQEKRLSSCKKWLRIPIALGISSYSLYLIHEPIILLKNHLIHNYIDTKFRDIMMIIGIIAVPIICYLNYLVFEKPFILFKKRQTNDQ